MCRSCCCFPWRWNHIQRRQSHLTWSDKKLCCHSCQYLWGHHDTLQVKFLSFHKNMELPDLLWNYDRQTDWRTDPLTIQPTDWSTNQPTDRVMEMRVKGTTNPNVLQVGGRTANRPAAQEDLCGGQCDHSGLCSCPHIQWLLPKF